MLPDFLVPGYRQYKEDTKAVAVYLASTARAYGYTSDKLPATGPTKTSGKSKAKTKKQQRDAARRIPRNQRTFVIDITDFVPLTLYVAENIKPPEKVPSSIIATIARVIEARRSTEEWFVQNQQEDIGHAYFISVLERVYELLKPLSMAPASAESDDEDTLVENAFGKLRVDEPSEAFLSSPGPSAKAAPTDPQADKMVYQFVDKFVEKFTIIFEDALAAPAFFKDVNKIYSYARKIWQQHSEGKVGLMTAALVSNTAIDLVRRLEEDFFEQFPRFWTVDEPVLSAFKRYDPRHRDAQQLINYMYRSKMLRRGVHPNTKFRQGEPQFNVDYYEDAQFFFIDMLQIFQEYYVYSQSMTKVCWRQDPHTEIFRGWNPEENKTSLSNRDKFVYDTRILLELLPDLVLLCTSPTRALAEDELLKACYALYHEKGEQPRLYVWSMMAARLFCEIHAILGPRIEKPFLAAQRLGKEAKATVARCIALRDQQQVSCWRPSLDSQIQENIIDPINNRLFEDEVREHIMERARNVKGGYSKPEFHLLKRHPLLCGLFEFSIRTALQELGVICLQNHQEGAMVAHLYNAVQQEGCCDTPWPDMDFLIHQQTPEKLFVGGPPTNPREYFQRAAIYRGISPQVFAKDRRRTGMILSKNTHRDILPMGMTHTILKIRHSYHHTASEALGMLDDLEEVVKIKHEITKSATRMTIRTRSPAEMRDVQKKRLTDEIKLAPIELLMALRFGVVQEMPDLLFDYMHLHGCCSVLLKSVYDFLKPDLETILPPEVLDEHEFLVCSLPFLIFTIGTTAQSLGAILKDKKEMLKLAPPNLESSIDQHAILLRVGEILKNKLQNGRFHSAVNSRVRKLERKEITTFQIKDISMAANSE